MSSKLPEIEWLHIPIDGEQQEIAGVTILRTGLGDNGVGHVARYAKLDDGLIVREAPGIGWVQVGRWREWQDSDEETEQVDGDFD